VERTGAGRRPERKRIEEASAGLSGGDGPQGCRDPRHGHLLPALLRAAGKILSPTPSELWALLFLFCSYERLRCGATLMLPIRVSPLAHAVWGRWGFSVSKDCVCLGIDGSISLDGSHGWELSPLSVETLDFRDCHAV
jgi:hypothetical protein